MNMRDFWYFAKMTAKDAVYSYFEPLRIIIAFFAIFAEMFKQAFTCMAVDSDDYKKLQELKLEEETRELVALGLPAEDVEKEI